MVKNFLKIITLLTLVFLVLTSCASTINIQVERTPTLNTAGIRRIAIMSFETSRDPTYRETAQYIVTIINRKIQEISNFSLVDSSMITRLQQSNGNIESYADAFFNGRITRIDSKDSERQSERKDKEGNVYTVITYEREVELEFNYYLTRVRDGTILGPVFKKDTTSSSNEDKDKLPSTIDLLRRIVDNQLKYLNRDLAPYTVTESRTLATERSKDKELKARMKEVLAQVKERNYRAALNSYLYIYEEYTNIAAGLNASILYEALGDTMAAADLMQAVFYETGNPKARSELTRLNKILADKATIATEYNGSGYQTDRVTVYASSEIQKILPANAKVWIYNNSVGNIMAEAIVDDLSAGLINRGISVVDRDNMALIEAERIFQTSGLVSDNDFVSIGNAAGANIIVIIAIIGTGDLRRLQLRVLDIERAVTIMQSDTSSAWKL